MRQFLQVLSFELKNFVCSKWFKVSTVLISVMVAVVMFVPNFLGNDMMESTQHNVNDKEMKIGLYDPSGVFKDQSVLQAGFPNAKFQISDSESQLKKEIESRNYEVGFVVENATTYRYYVLDSKMQDQNEAIFTAIMGAQYRNQALSSLGVDPMKATEILNTPIQGSMEALGKDGVSNYFYTYILVFALYFVVIFYGQMTASGVASEKGNRSIEILITSANSNALIFGKVIAGAVAGILQTSVLLGISTLAYRFNAEAWNHALDFLFNIPASVLVVFAVFGTLGYLFYSFIYGALGAMVSKVEEVGSAITPVTLIFIISFFMTIFAMMNPDSTIGFVASYLPFSSCMAMFSRVAMGSVGMAEILISAAILIVSTIGMGLLGAKLYRRGTLQYGNEFKFSKLIKELKRHKD